MKLYNIRIAIIALFFMSQFSNAQDFITTWQTNNPGASLSTSIRIPIFSGETYNYDVDWDNDGVFDEFGITGEVTHNYGIIGIGEQTIRIQGLFPRIYFNNEGDKEKLLSVDQWGDNEWSSMEKSFDGCSNLVINAMDTPVLSNVLSTKDMFRNATSLNQEIGNWNMSNIENTSRMFFGASSFNQDIGSWNTSSVTNMLAMFMNAADFNIDISNWNTGNVNDMRSIFNNAVSFNQDIRIWDMSNVNSISNMFRNATSFNQDISNWDTGNVTNMSGAFFNATSFNQDISDWNVGNVTTMEVMFQDAISFDQNLSNWNVSQVTVMSGMFENDSLSVDNYDSLLIGWNSQILQDNVLFDGGNSVYCNGEIARNNMMSTYNWIITDNGGDCTIFNSFITKWQTNNPGTSNDASITIPTFSGEAYNYDVDWDNDGVFDEYGITGDVTHNFGIGDIGEHTVRIQGEFPRIYFNNLGDKEKLLSIDQWGIIPWTSMEHSFYGCSNLVINAMDSPDLSGVQSSRNMFRDAISMNQDIGDWDLSNITTMRSMFQGATSFNQNIENWATGIVTDMKNLFANAVSFDQNIGNWDVGNVTDMSGMFLNDSLSLNNYDNILIAWNTQVLQDGVSFDGGNSIYCNGESARNNMIISDNWSFTDGGLDCSTLGAYDIELNTVSIYPNPVKNKLFINGLDESTLVIILDNSGKELLRVDVNIATNGIDLTHLKSNVYLIKIVSESGITIDKIIKYN